MPGSWEFTKWVTVAKLANLSNAGTRASDSDDWEGDRDLQCTFTAWAGPALVSRAAAVREANGTMIRSFGPRQIRW